MPVQRVSTPSASLNDNDVIVADLRAIRSAARPSGMRPAPALVRSDRFGDGGGI